MVRIFRKLVFSSISIRLFAVALGFVSSVLANRALGLELRGAYTTVYSYANLLNTVFNLGIAYALVPLSKAVGYQRAKDAIDTCLWLQFFICVACSVLFLIFSFSLRNLFVAVLTCLLILNGQVIFVALIEDIKSRNTTLLFSAVLYAVANVALVLLWPHKLYVALTIFALKNIIEICVCSYRQRLFHFRISDVNIDIIKAIARYGLPSAILAFLITCNYNIDVVILNILHVGDNELGILGVMYSLSNMLWFIPDAFKEYVYNKSAKEASEGLTLVLIFFNMIICTVICLGFLILGKPFLAIMYGEEYVAAFPATFTVFIGIIPMVAFKLIHPIYINEGKSLTVAMILLVAVAINCACAFILVPEHGAFGAALATVAAYSLCGSLFFIKFVCDYKLSITDFTNNLEMID